MPDLTFTSTRLNRPLPSIEAPIIIGASGQESLPINSLTGVYSYRVTSFNGGETQGSIAEALFDGTGSAIGVYFEPVAEATDYRLYRANSGESNYRLVADGQVSPIIDLDEIVNGPLLPTGNTTDKISRTPSRTETVFYQVPVDNRTLVKELLASNSYSETVYLTVYYVPNGEEPSDGNSIVSNDSVEERETKIYSLNTVLESGDKIYAKVDKLGVSRGFGSLTFKISGIEITG